MSGAHGTKGKLGSYWQRECLFCRRRRSKRQLSDNGPPLLEGKKKKGQIKADVRTVRVCFGHCPALKIKVCAQNWIPVVQQRRSCSLHAGFPWTFMTQVQQKARESFITDMQACLCEFKTKGNSHKNRETLRNTSHSETLPGVFHQKPLCYWKPHTWNTQNKYKY